MTEYEIKKRLKEIKHLAELGWNSLAPEKEDELREDFLKWVAGNKSSIYLSYDTVDILVKKAKMVLRSSKYNFERWCV